MIDAFKEGTYSPGGQDIDAGLVAPQPLTVDSDGRLLVNNDDDGRHGTVYINAAMATYVPPSGRYVRAIEINEDDTVISGLTGNMANSTQFIAAAGTMKEGRVLFGRFSSVKLSTGSAILTLTKYVPASSS